MPCLKLKKKSGRKIWNIFQLRLHPAIIALRDKVQKELSENPDKVYDIDLTYLTSRGHWYFISWKGDIKKSGGIATNIGVHFYDMISWIFGSVKKNIVHLHQEDAASGFLELEHARVRWFLSVNYKYIPEIAKSQGKRTYRSITVNGKDKQWLAALSSEGNVFESDDPEDEQLILSLNRFPEGSIALLTRDETLLVSYPGLTISPLDYLSAPIEPKPIHCKPCRGGLRLPAGL
jgi:predicted dehydrogenase